VDQLPGIAPVLPSDLPFGGVETATPVTVAPAADTMPVGGAIPAPIFSWPQIDPNELLPVVGIAATALSAAVIVRSVCAPSPSLLFTNVRLLPCIVNATVQQTTAAASSVFSRAEGGSSGISEKGHDESILVPFKHGFEQAVRHAPRHPIDDETWDSRLLAQIGIVLGTVYLAFLTVWFWATRLRWNPRY
jgi:hypothetical protein